MAMPALHTAADVEINELADLGEMDPATINVVVLAEHRQSCDGPAVFGPFATAAKAHTFVVAQYRRGDFDVDGCSVQYRTTTR